MSTINTVSSFSIGLGCVSYEGVTFSMPSSNATTAKADPLGIGSAVPTTSTNIRYLCVACGGMTKATAPCKKCGSTEKQAIDATKGKKVSNAPATVANVVSAAPVVVATPKPVAPATRKEASAGKPCCTKCGAGGWIGLCGKCRSLDVAPVVQPAPVTRAEVVKPVVAAPVIAKIASTVQATKAPVVSENAPKSTATWDKQGKVAPQSMEHFSMGSKQLETLAAMGDKQAQFEIARRAHNRLVG